MSNSEHLATVMVNAFIDAVDRGGDDTAGIARALANGIQSRAGYALHILPAQDPQRRARSRFYAREHRFLHIEPAHLPAERTAGHRPPENHRIHDFQYRQAV